MRINYYFEDIEEIELPQKLEHWIKEQEEKVQKEIKVNYIFVTEERILEINKTYLNHDYYTDIITFDLSESNASIEADIFISIETIKSNAKERNISFANELRRVLAHGILHLTGYNDKTEEEQIEMTKQEDIAIEKLL